MLALLIVVLAALAVAVLYFKAKGKDAVQAEGHAAALAPEHLDMGVRGVNRAAGRGAMRRRQRRRVAASSDEGSEESEDEQPRRGGRQQEPPQEHGMTKRDAYEARRAARDAAREAQEAAQEEEIRRAAEERARKEEEEARKWMHLFSVEAAGEEALSQEEGAALQARFADYIRARKTVALDELAAEFGLRTAEAVKRVQALEAEGAITGVMDDRGKFIYVSMEEMAAVADFIRQRGRIAISELAAKSNQFIDLEARATVAAGELDVGELAALGAA